MFKTALDRKHIFFGAGPARPSFFQKRTAFFALALTATQTTANADPRDFNADTPGRSHTPYTVADGYFQLESDAIHITGLGSTQIIEALDPILKYGLTDNLELELQTAGLLNQPVTNNNKTTRATGWGDTTPAVKYNLFGNNSPDFSAAIIAGVKIPTATRGFGNGQLEYNGLLTTQAALPLGLTLQVQQEIDLLRNQADNGHHANFGEDIALGRSFDKLTISIDTYADSGTDHRIPPFYTADLGLAYATSSTSLISLGAYAGLSRTAPPLEIYLGFAFRF